MSSSERLPSPVDLVPVPKPVSHAHHTSCWSSCCGGRGQAPPPWQRRWLQIMGTIRARMQTRKDQPQTILELMVRMYEHEDVVAELTARDARVPTEAVLYLNSIMNFLLNGEYEQSRELERFLLAKCSRSLRFAHRMHWYLSSHASTSGYMSEARQRSSATGGIVPVPLLQAVDIYGSWAAVATTPPGPSPATESSEAKSLHTDPSPPQPGVSPRSSFSGVLAEAGSTNGKNVSRGVSGDIVVPSEVGHSNYMDTLNLIENLTNLADALIPLRPQDRKVALQAGLQRINEVFCHGSNHTYLPIGTGNNRIIRIHYDKAKPFSTKSRVPCFVVFEVIDYDLAQRIRNGEEKPRNHGSNRRKSIRDVLKAGLSRMGLAQADGEHAEHHDLKKMDSVLEEGGIIVVNSPLKHSHGEPKPSHPLEGDVEMKHAGVTVELVPMPVEFKAAENLVEEDVVMAVSARRDSSVEDFELESELKEGLEGFDASLGDADHVVMPAAGDRTPTASQHELNRIASAQAMFGQPWESESEEVRAHSHFGKELGWRLVSAIVKSNDDLRQEQFVSQLLKRFAAIAKQDKLPVWICDYDILATGPRTGIIEGIPNTMSLDSLKKTDPYFTSLADFFQRRWGSVSDAALEAAQKCFVQSLAAYSIITYILQIKDRHNGNLMIDNKGHLIHIDFGFVFTNSPGGNSKFENAPFKLTSEFVELMGGPRSSLFQAYRKLCVRTFLSFRKRRDDVIVMVEMMLAGNPDIPGFRGGPDAVMDGLHARFLPGASKRAAARHVHSLIDQSYGSWRTSLYDKYQRCCEGIL